jgi:hypothetical protein
LGIVGSGLTQKAPISAGNELILQMFRGMGLSDKTLLMIEDDLRATQASALTTEKKREIESKV